jgi:hypothetical protein
MFLTQVANKSTFTELTKGNLSYAQLTNKTFLSQVANKLSLTQLANQNLSYSTDQ